MIFVLDTGEHIPADEIKPEQICRAIALIRPKEGDSKINREIIRRVKKD